MLSQKNFKKYSSKIDVSKELKMSLHGRRQKPIGALNSARIGEDAKKGWGVG
jgi:hypothetical protein